MPTVIPETIPESEPIVATAVVPEVHTPPITGSVSVVVVPTHNALAPTMGAGAAVTVTGIVAMHPLSGVV